MDTDPALERKRCWSTPALLLAWGFAVLAVVGTLAGAHLLTLPVPSRVDPRLVTAMQPVVGDARWSMLHVLRGECRCSQRIAAYLIRRGAQPGTRERVVLVSPDAKMRNDLEAAGFPVTVVSEDALERDFGIQAVPLLAIATDRGVVEYVGGYTERKQGPVPADRRILAALRAGETVTTLPLFGCATSDGLKKASDPLGVR